MVPSGNAASHISPTPPATQQGATSVTRTATRKTSPIQLDIQATQCVVHIPKALKTTKPGKQKAPITLNSYSDDKQCIVKHLYKYIQTTAPLRGNYKGLLISHKKPHRPVTVNTLSRWAKEVMTKAGIDVQTFGDHSTRGAATSAVAQQGLSLDIILKAGNWQNARTFERFYHREPVPTTGICYCGPQNVGMNTLKQNYCIYIYT